MANPLRAWLVMAAGYLLGFAQQMEAEVVDVKKSEAR